MKYSVHVRPRQPLIFEALSKHVLVSGPLNQINLAGAPGFWRALELMFLANAMPLRRQPTPRGPCCSVALMMCSVSSIASCVGLQTQSGSRIAGNQASEDRFTGAGTRASCSAKKCRFPSPPPPPPPLVHDINRRRDVRAAVLVSSSSRWQHQ